MQAVPMRQMKGPDGQLMLAPEGEFEVVHCATLLYIILLRLGYTMRQVQPAKNYDVVSFGRAMNDDFGGRVKKLFDPEREAALSTLNSGEYFREISGPSFIRAFRRCLHWMALS
jgi:hypothetical protein